ncbi:MAG: hypothetical protein NUV55_09885 [Sulfuricaulis sp.]|uniref:hypothetical protein n=1 Tax=Sulfuricaulis sp. TaxID=2003553 RepID=UPI0025E7ACC1|nr:hypothetical protein [Sulfuricaulis sp.]MCR4347492.1 hypothetical protein [Sulfuricaulis sp.]
MKTVNLQLITIDLENGQQGVFIGFPLITEENSELDSQVEEIWFSNIQEIPDDLSVKKLMSLIAIQLCRCRASLQ